MDAGTRSRVLSKRLPQFEEAVYLQQLGGRQRCLVIVLGYARKLRNAESAIVPIVGMLQSFVEAM